MSKSKNLKLTICLGSLLAPWLVASANLPVVAAALTLDTVVSMPIFQSGAQKGKQSVLRAFDISFVDPNSHTYALAASALFGTGTGPDSQPGVVTIDTSTMGINLLAVGQFAGNCPNPNPPATAGLSGPNGLVIIGKRSGLAMVRSTPRLAIRPANL
jgi:hypothetical protein